MTEIDNLMARVADDPAEIDLGDLESQVWGRIGERAQRRRLGRVRLLAVTGALFIGVINGGMGLVIPTSKPSEIRVLTLSAGLSPMAAMGIDG